MGKPSEQIRCDDWTAGFILDEAALTLGGWLDNEVKRYQSHVPEVASGAKKATPPSLDSVIEYQRALIEGTPFRRILHAKKLRSRRAEADK